MTKIVIDLPEEVYASVKNGTLNDIQSMYICGSVANGIPYEEISQCECVEEIIEELESRKDYGTEYAQAMEDVIVILKAKFGIDNE